MKAHQTYDNSQLWADVAAGKKYLIWRIGHERHTVTAVDKIDGKLVATLDGAIKRPVKGRVCFGIYWNHHPEYRVLAERLLALIRARVEYEVRLIEHPGGVYRYERDWNGGVYAADCGACLFDGQPQLERHAEAIIRILNGQLPI